MSIQLIVLIAFGPSLVFVAFIICADWVGQWKRRNKWEIDSDDARAAQRRRRK